MVILEYCSVGWDPYTQEGKKTVEAVQCRTARFTLKRYQNISITEMLDQLKGKPLTVRRTRYCLTFKLFYKAANNIIDIDIVCYLIPGNSHTRTFHQQKYMYL